MFNINPKIGIDGELFRKIPEGLRNRIIEITINKIPGSLESKTFPAKFRRFVSMASKSYRERHYNWVTIFGDIEKDHLFADDFKREINDKNYFSYLNNAFLASTQKNPLLAFLSV